MQGVFGPPGGKHLIAFIPPLELLKLWVDYGFWYANKTSRIAALFLALSRLSEQNADMQSDCGIQLLIGMPCRPQEHDAAHCQSQCC